MKNLIKLLIVFLIIFTLVGCSKITQENYDKIKVGMDYQQVIEILGEADKCDEVLGAKSCIWGDDQKNIKIKFVVDKVMIPTMTGL